MTAVKEDGVKMLSSEIVLTLADCNKQLAALQRGDTEDARMKLTALAHDLDDSLASLEGMAFKTCKSAIEAINKSLKHETSFAIAVLACTIAMAAINKVNEGVRYE